MQQKDDGVTMKMNAARRKIAVILSNMESEYVVEILRGMEEEAYARGMDVYVFNANASADESIKHNIGEYTIFQLVDYTQFDGVVFFANLIQGYSVYRNMIEQITKSGVKCVCIDAELEEFYSVGGADYVPMKELVSHLIEHHHYTKINYISGQEFNSDSRERLAAYCDAMEEHGLAVEEQRIFKGAFTRAHGREAAEKMLESPQLMPEAVVCATDSIAMGVRSVFKERGISVPQQVALVGFDNIFEARNSVPRLTTIARDQIKMGREAVRTIAKLIDGEEVPRRQEIEGKLMVRESCGCSGERDEDATLIHRKYVSTTLRYEQVLDSNNKMMEDLSAVKHFKEYLSRIKTYVKEGKAADYYICLNQSLVEHLKNDGGCVEEEQEAEGKPGFDTTMSAVIVYEKRVFHESIEFPTKQMIPRLPRETEEPCSYLFLPLHFRERALGYLVLRERYLERFSLFFRARVINLANSLERLRKQVRLQRMIEKVDQMYVMDALTGLYNRFGFSRYTGESFSRCVIQDDSFMIFFADLDGLKEINDRFGHEDGDIAIRTVAHVLQQVCVKKEICARIGGDEFVVYAEGYTEADAVAFCRKVGKLLECANEELNAPYRVSASYGYEVVYPDVGDTLSKYIDRADDKMYVNKKKKKERQTDNVRIVT